MKIEILFARPKKWLPISWLIRVIEGSKFSHSAIAYDDYNAKLVVDSTSHKVKIQPIEIFEKKYKIIETVIVDVNSDYFLNEIMNHIGKEYGYLTIFGMAIQRFCHLFGLKIGNPFGDGDDTFVCSEVVIYMLQCSSDEYQHLNAELDGPQQLYEAVK